MNKREFLKASGAMLTTALLPHLAHGEDKAKRTNWSANYTYSTDRLYTPSTVEEVQRIVKSAPSLRPLGRTHSFNGIADSTAAQITLTGLESMQIDKAAHTVTVGAGVTYGKLAPYIDAQGFAVPNLASLPHISVVGACCTGTHGSGVKNGNLSAAVAAIEVVNANGEVATLSRAKMGNAFDGAVVALGALGVVTKITLNLVPTFQIAQTVYQNLSFDQLEHHLEEVMSAGYSVSLFTDWQQHRVLQVWVKQLAKPGDPAPPQTLFGATAATRKLHPIEATDPINCTEQLGVPGPWYERLPHFRMNFTPSSGHEIQTEYFVPRKHAYQAILAVEQLRDQITPHLFITELRTIAADNFWLSPAYQRDCLAIHFTWKPEEPQVRALLPAIEAKLAPFDARPHWAKVFTMAPARLQQLYPRLADFKQLAQQHDPQGKFRNAFLTTNLYTP